MAATDAQLRFIISMVDQSQAQFAEISKNLANIKAQSQQTSSSFAQMGPAFTQLRNVGAVAFAALSGEFYLATGAAAESAKSVKQLNAVIASTKGVAGVTSQAIQDYSGEMQKLTNYSDEEINGSAALMLTFTKIGKDVFPMAQTAAMNMSAALGQDLKSSALQLGKALQDPERGINALRRAGVSFTSEQKEYIKTLVESGQQEKAQLIILKELETEFGGMAKAIASPATILKNQMDEMQESIGRALLPMLRSFQSSMLPIIENITKWVNANPELVRTIAMVAFGIAGLAIAIGTLGLAFIALSAGMSPFAGVWASVGTAIIAMNGVIIPATWAEWQLVGANIAATASSFTFAGALKAVTAAFISSGWGIILVLVGLIAFKILELSNTVGGLGKALTYVGDEMLKWFAAWITGWVDLIQWVGKYVAAIQLLKSPLDWLKSKMKGISDSANASQDDISAQAEASRREIEKATQAAAVASAKLEKYQAGLLDDMSALSDGSKASTDAMKKHWEDLVKELGDVRTQMKSMYDDMTKAQNDYLGKVGDEQKSYQDSVVDMVAGAQKDIVDLNVKKNQAMSKGDDQSVMDLSQQLAEKQAIIVSYHSLQLNLDNEIKAKQDALNMNALQQLTLAHDQKLKSMQEEFLQDQVLRLQKILQLAQENQQIISLVGEQKVAKLEADVEMAKSEKQRLEDARTGLTNWVTDTTTIYQNYASSIKSIMNSISTVGAGGFVNPNASYITPRASGGPVSSGSMYLVGEQGPELFSPGKSGYIYPNGSMGGGNGLTVVVSGNTFVGREGIADSIANDIMKKIKQNVRLA